MDIAIITCHDVYNVGASLQAYALSSYLQNLGHKVSIIDYKPEYLSNHYPLWGAVSPKYNKPFVRQLYSIYKLPNRLKHYFGRKKRAFDSFTSMYLPVTDKRYVSYSELLHSPPLADTYIAGSDQIWNPLFKNGRDPSFFLLWAPAKSKRISYAASIATDSLTSEDKDRFSLWLTNFDDISIRESSGATLLLQCGYQTTVVCDPVFLITKENWASMVPSYNKKEYLLFYDFDRNSYLKTIAESVAKKKNLSIIDVQKSQMGPLEFLSAIKDASCVVTNSFHAVAFSIIFEKPFLVGNRTERINTRMQDLVDYFGVSERLISDKQINNIGSLPRIQWETINVRKRILIDQSIHFLSKNI